MNFKNFSLFFSCLFFASNAYCAKILISKVVDHPALNETVRGIIEGLSDSGFKQGENLELRVESAQANSAIASQIASKFASQNPDLVVGVGTISAQSFLKYTPNLKMIFSSVTDPKGSSLTRENISGVSNFVALPPQIKMMKSILPNLKTLGILYNPAEINSISILKRLKSLCEKSNISLVEQSITRTADIAQSCTKIAQRVDALFISNDNTALSGLKLITRIATKFGIPVFVSDTDAVVKNGALAALGPNQYEVGYQTGMMIAQTIKGESPPIEYPKKQNFS